MRLNEFRLVSLREEKCMSDDELEKYYADIRNYVVNKKLQVTTKGATTIAPKLKKYVNKIARKLVPILAGGNV